MRRSTLVCMLAIPLLLCHSKPAAAIPSIVNGGFGSPGAFSIAGWGTAGSTGQFGATFDTISPFGSSFPNAGGVANVNESSPGSPITSSVTSLELPLGLSSGSLSGFFPTMSVGSVIGQQDIVNGQVGERISFEYDFLTNDTTAGDAFAFATLTNGITGQQQIFDLGGIPATPSAGTVSFGPGLIFNDTSGVETEVLTLPSTGTYELGFGIVSVANPSQPTAVLVTDVQGLPTPEIDPCSAATPVALALGLLLLLDRRSKRPA